MKENHWIEEIEVGVPAFSTEAYLLHLRKWREEEQRLFLVGQDIVIAEIRNILLETGVNSLGWHHGWAHTTDGDMYVVRSEPTQVLVNDKTIGTKGEGNPEYDAAMRLSSLLHDVGVDFIVDWFEAGYGRKITITADKATMEPSDKF